MHNRLDQTFLSRSGFFDIHTDILLLQSDSSSQDFYSRTVAALDRKDTSDEEVAHKLQAVKDAANSQERDGRGSPQKPIIAVADDKKPVDVPIPSEIGSTDRGGTGTMDGGDRSVAGRKILKGGETKDVHSGKEAPKYPDTSKEKEDGDEKEEKAESEEDHAIETELNTILKKSPSMLPFRMFLTARLQAS